MEWGKSIRELVGKNRFIEKRLEDYIGNSKIHVFDMRFLNSEVRERFQGDVRIVLDYLSDRERLIGRKQKMKATVVFFLRLVYDIESE